MIRYSSPRLESFKDYLNQKAEDLADREGFSSYFNIPYILTADSSQMETFKPLFEKEWLDGVTEEVVAIAEEMAPEQDENSDHPAGVARTVLDEIFRFFVKEQTKSTGSEPFTDYEEIERRADSVSAEVHALKVMKEKKMEALNVIASKYEAVKEDYLNFQSEIDMEYRLEMTGMPCIVFVEGKAKKSAVEEKQKYEDDAQLDLQKELGRKLTPQEVKTFKQQYKEKFGNYRIVGFNASNNIDFLNGVEKIWKRVMFEFSRTAYGIGSLKAKELEDNPKKDDKKDDKKQVDDKSSAEIKNKLSDLQIKFNSYSSKLKEYEAHVNMDPSAVPRLQKDLGLNSDLPYEKGYKLSDDYIAKSLPSLVKDSAPVGYFPERLEDRFHIVIYYLFDKLTLDKSFKSVHDLEAFSSAYSSLTSNLQKVMEDHSSFTEKIRLELDLTLNYIHLQSLKDGFMQILLQDSSLANLHSSFLTFFDQNSTSFTDPSKFDYYLKTLLRMQRILFDITRPLTLKNKDLLSSQIAIYTNKKSYPLSSHSWHLEAKELVLSTAILCNKSLVDLMDIEKDNLMRVVFEDLADISSKNPSSTLPPTSILVDSILTLAALVGSTDKLKRFRNLEQIVKSLESREELGLNKHKTLE